MPAATAKRPAAPAQDPTFREVITTFAAIKRVMEPYFAGFGIGGSQWGVLRTLDRAAEEGRAALRLTELSDRMILRPPSVAEVVNRLVRDGLVTRADDVLDQRAKQIKLTAAGRRLVRRVLQNHAQQIEKVLGGLSQSERRRLRGLLGKMRSHVDGLLATSATNGSPKERTAA